MTMLIKMITMSVAMTATTKMVVAMTTAAMSMQMTTTRAAKVRAIATMLAMEPRCKGIYMYLYICIYMYSP